MSTNKQQNGRSNVDAHEQQMQIRHVIAIELLSILSTRKNWCDVQSRTDICYHYRRPRKKRKEASPDHILLIAQARELHVTSDARVQILHIQTALHIERQESN